MKSSTRRSSTAPATSMKPSTRSSTSKPSPATAMKSSTRSSTTKKLSTRPTTAMKSSPRRCMIPHISRNGLSPGGSAVRVEIAAPKPSRDYEYEFDDLDVLEENESWLQTPVHKMPSEGMNKMVAKGEADTDENQILDSTDEELSVAAMSDLLNVLEEDVPGLQKPLPKKPSEGMTKMAVQDEACTWRNSKLFKLFDAFSKSERHKLYPTVVSPPKDREPLLYDFFDYNYYFEDDVSKATDGGANSIPANVRSNLQDYEYEFDDLDVLEENESWLQTPVRKMPSEGMNKMVAQGEADTDENQILDSTDEELSVAAMSDRLNVLEEDAPGLQKPLPKKPSEGMTKMAVQDETCTWRNSKLFKLFDAFSKSERHKLYPSVVSPPKDREPLLYDFFDYNYYFEDDVSKATDGGANSTPPRYNLRTRRSRTNTMNLEPQPSWNLASIVPIICTFLLYLLILFGESSFTTFLFFLFSSVTLCLI